MNGEEIILRTRLESAQNLSIELQKVWGRSRRFEFENKVLEYYQNCLEAGLPQEYLDLTWDDYQNSDRDALRSCKQFAENIDYYWRSGGGLLLTGLNGSGKSFLSYMIAKTAIVKKIPTMCLSISEMVMKKQLSRFQSNLYMEMLEGIQFAKVLIIDDFGKEFSSDNKILSQDANTTIFHIFKKGIIRSHIVNTALVYDGDKEGGAFEKTVGTSLFSRLSKHEIVPIIGQDFRKLKLNPTLFSTARRPGADHSHCWEAHIVLTKESIEQLKDDVCQCCKYRFHPVLCQLRFQNKWRKG